MGSGLASFSNLNTVFSSFKYLEYQSRAIGPFYSIIKFQTISSPHPGGAPATNVHFGENAAYSKAAGEIKQSSLTDMIDLGGLCAGTKPLSVR